MTIYDLALLLELEIEVVWGYSGGWIAHLKSRGGSKVEVKESRDSCIIGGLAGWGDTPEKAIAGMVESLRGQILVINAFDKEKRREFQVTGSLTI